MPTERNIWHYLHLAFAHLRSRISGYWNLHLIIFQKSKLQLIKNNFLFRRSSQFVFFLQRSDKL
jgi:hypothetical protein